MRPQKHMPPNGLPTTTHFRDYECGHGPRQALSEASRIELDIFHWIRNQVVRSLCESRINSPCMNPAFLSR